MNKKIIYLAGPINSCGIEEARSRREYATHRLKEFGYEVRDPMRPGNHISESNFPIGQIVERDLQDLKDSDIILVDISGIKNAGIIPCGTFMEMFESHRYLKKTVITVADDFYSIWMDMHSDKIFNSITEALDYICK